MISRLSRSRRRSLIYGRRGRRGCLLLRGGRLVRVRQERDVRVAPGQVVTRVGMCHYRWLSLIREGWLRQIGWIFGKVPKGGGSFSKICVVDFWNFSVQNLYIHNLHFAFALCNWVSTNNYRDVHFLLVFETLTSAAAMIWSQRATFGHFLFVFLLTLVFQTSARTNHDFLCTLRSLQSNLHVSF